MNFVLILKFECTQESSEWKCFFLLSQKR